MNNNNNDVELSEEQLEQITGGSDKNNQSANQTTPNPQPIASSQTDGNNSTNASQAARNWSHKVRSLID